MRLVYSSNFQARAQLKSDCEAAAVNLESACQELQKTIEEMNDHNKRVRALPWYKSIFQCEYDSLAFWPYTSKLDNRLEKLRKIRSILHALALENGPGPTVILDNSDVEIIQIWKD